MNNVEALQKQQLVAVIREASEDNIIDIVSALSKGGIHAVEITAETRGVSKLIDLVVTHFGRDVYVGAGTVLDGETARSVIMAGASFVVSPTVNSDTIRMTKRYGVISIPGALTPTEILTAYESGADMVKIFPANVFGPGYVKSLKGPFPTIPFMVTGGIHLDNVAEYSAKGGVVIGIGSNLVNPNHLHNEEDFAALTKEARRYVEALKKES
ncbi:bifunctional 4-hydroxy-2-oxoglutarate aldolase/2-dehydro-3-deoxy-phosphogluconate aldolase [Salisediminibacterium beveridgei]|uniref:4-Hydroxy-2-oxoglutarate aldolase / 2-dehydro-3-deoxyphosphogluconate aldolase n=1 Tax=Salisediminibacterium beveridgei TaxID=632773 RepID=A0A1D7QRJ9_9BACI|nr:bifunctional 4-hydroxy-2-oxoglutarate aldolase/2-dehydro-3-deoxy-phosphogluconate aldolase [Salisediminibacterium beveridgei]AOM81637.1 4-Hydroxy-2-oxoglutarate aldolase / 2-dehydro-3-deoxyphosphogluconate aldolase [Salisediminibacterium beveridgei]